MIAFLVSLVLVVLISLGAWFGLEQVDRTAAEAYSAPSVRLGELAEAPGLPEVESGPGVAESGPRLSFDEAVIDQRAAANQALQPDAVRLTPIDETVESGPEAE